MARASVAAGVAIGIALQLASGVASARDKLQGVFEGTIGWTDNVTSSPYNPPPGVAPREADAFSVLSPGIVYAEETPSELQRVGYAYSFNLFFAHPEADSSTHRLDYRSVFELSPRLELVLGATGAWGHQHTAGTMLSTAETTVVSAFPGSSAFVGVSAEQLLNWDIAPDWRGYQGTGFAMNVPIRPDIPAPRTYVPSARLGLERVFWRNGLGIEGKGEYDFIQNAIGARGEQLGDQRQLVGSGVFRWRHDWGYWWASYAEAGVVEVWRINRGSHYFGPIGGAGFGYARREGEAMLEYSHGVTTNVVYGQTILADSVRLHGIVPIHEKPNVFVATSVGYSKGKIIDQDGNLATPLDVFLGDAAIAYEPIDQLRLSLRYQHIDQRADPSNLPPLPLNYIRNTAMFIATFTLPREQDMPQRYRRPLRVDGSDGIRPIETETNEPAQHRMQP